MTSAVRAAETAPAGVDVTARHRRLIALAGVAALVATHALIVVALDGYFDIRVYHGAINHWVDGGDLYAYTLDRTRYGYTYPPFAAFTMSPMALVSVRAAMVIALLVNTVATAAVLCWLVAPIARSRGWDRWLTVAGAGALGVAFEPLSDTFGFGQVNMILLALVVADVVLLLGPGRRAAGLGIGLATAIKLTPGIFIVYLLVMRRWRAAAVASATAAVATLTAAVVAPQASREYWTEALWHPERIGDAWIVNNQSLSGLVTRLNPVDPSGALWVVLALGAGAVWFVRARAAVAAGDTMAGFALTGVLACLVSPITWIHHLVWLIPAIVLLVDNAYAATTPAPRRRVLLWLAAVSYALLCSRLIFLFRDYWFTGWGLVGSNAFVILTAVLLVAVPIRSRPPALDDHGAVSPALWADQPR